MISDLEYRIVQLELALQKIGYTLSGLQAAIDALNQAQRGNSFPGGTGGGGGGGAFFATLTGAIGPGGPLATGSPASLPGQTVYRISGSAFVVVAPSATLVNGLPNGVTAGRTCILLQNSDGNFVIIGVAC